MLKYLIISSISIVAIISIVATIVSLETKMDSEAKHVFYHLDSPSSFDPLEADRAANLPIARMLFLTPIEISVNNDLVSTVLESFSYDPKNKIISFFVRSDLKYSDGQPITVNDVVLSITRMLHARPDFPVIKEIIGTSDWLTHKYPLQTLPSGIHIEKNKISISLRKNVLNPLFRFTLELFSIIPEKCVNLETAELTCKIPPSSGYYSLIKQENSLYEFQLRSQPIAHGITVPEHINLSYINSKQLADFDYSKHENAIVFGLEYFYLNTRLSKNVPDLKFKYLPYSYFYSLVFNPNIKPFDRVECRKEFVSKFRDNLKNVTTSEFNFSKSIFTPILPGYLADQKFEKAEILVKQCYIPKDLTFFDPKDNSFFSEALQKTYKDFSIEDKQLTKPESILSAEKQFIENKLAILTFGSGFWSLDPVGDLQMMFTPKLHPRLKFITDNANIRSLLQDLENINSDSEVVEKMKSFNLYLNQTSLMSVYLHSRKFYASKHIEQLRELPQQISAPSIWQIFK